MTGVSECSQQRGNLKDDGYIRSHLTYLGLSASLLQRLPALQQE
ncbi:hypothetical protein [Photorhabdus bodei]|nr:hypothetical protein [Photorhabdus bodei]